MTSWTPSSWQTKTTLQQPTYPDPQRVAKVCERLAKLPPLVTSWEVETLKWQLADCAEGRRFLLQGGDCAEVFSDCEPSIIANKLKILLQMSLVLLHGGRLPVVRVGRFAGQYAKPRSENTETVDGRTLPTYRGDLINGAEFTEEERVHDPQRMMTGYSRSALTLNFIRSLVDGGFADLHHPEYWDLTFMEHSPMKEEYERMVESIGNSLSFMETMIGRHVGEINRVDFFTSHEGLHLLYEQAQTRQVPHRRGWFNLAAHSPWIGMRTAQLDGGHVEYFRGIRNPIGVKIGPAVEPEELLGLVRTLNPEGEPGRLTLIHRFGHDKIADGLPRLLEAVRDAGYPVLWCCDPMHGNTVRTAGGLKTRRFDHILGELDQAFDIHADCGTRLGGARGLRDEELGRAYQTFVDPRLNYEQALELAMNVAQRMRRKNHAR